MRTSEGKTESFRLSSTAGLDLEKFVRLNSVLGVNLKPNEDADYAEHPFLPMSPMEALRTGRWQNLDNLQSADCQCRELSEECDGDDWLQ